MNWLNWLCICIDIGGLWVWTWIKQNNVLFAKINFWHECEESDKP